MCKCDVLIFCYWIEFYIQKYARYAVSDLCTSELFDYEYLAISSIKCIEDYSISWLQKKKKKNITDDDDDDIDD